jgi:hypothetical protein
MGLGLYFLSPFEIGMSLEKPELYDLGRAKLVPAPPHCHAPVQFAMRKITTRCVGEKKGLGRKR